MKINYYISFLLVFLTTMQSIIPQENLSVKLNQVETKKLDGYFTRLKRGISCLLKRKPCTLEERETVRNTSFLLLLALWLLVHRPWVKHPTPDEVTTMYKHIREANIAALQSNITQCEQQGKTIPFESLLLSTLRVLYEVQSSQKIINHQLTRLMNLSSKDPQLNIQLDEIKANKLAEIKRRRVPYDNNEVSLKEIAKYLIPKAGHISHDRLIDTKVNQETLKELGLIK